MTVKELKEILNDYNEEDEIVWQVFDLEYMKIIEGYVKFERDHVDDVIRITIAENI